MTADLATRRFESLREKRRLWRDAAVLSRWTTRCGSSQRAEDAENRLGTAASSLPRGLAAIDLELGSEEALRLEERRLTEEIAEVEAELGQASKGHELSERLETLVEANARRRRQEGLNAEQAVGAQDLLTRFTNGRLVFQAEESASEPRFVAANADEPRRPVAQLDAERLGQSGRSRHSGSSDCDTPLAMKARDRVFE
ncbi:MAG TPA: hypothetical protein PKM73_21060 [Verrucomicrobiota bacterium]|nr:hypothetical protein [Verrucomicrobiota bacterium]HNU50655.1 hypothetical protein [Verrucomicrobiota bacterium]